MKKIKLTLDQDQMEYFARYLAQIQCWTEVQLRGQQLDPAQELLMIATASPLRKLANTVAIRLQTPAKLYKLTLNKGNAEAVYAFFILEPAPYPYRVRNEIFLQIDPFFRYDATKILKDAKPMSYDTQEIPRIAL